MSGMRYRTFLPWNALGGLCWGVTFTLAGYFAGKSYERVISVASTASTFLIVAVVVLIGGFLIWRRVRERRRASADDAAETGQRGPDVSEGEEGSDG